MDGTREHAPAEAEHPSVALRGGVVRFGSTTVLHGVDLDLQPGMIHALVGQNGAGKTTLVKALIGVNELASGSLEVAGQQRTWSGPQDARAAGLEIVYQDQPLVPHLTVLENLFVGRELATGPLLDLAEMRRTAERVLREIDADCDVDDLIDDLTPTQRVQVSIAAALAAGPRVLILDEPTAALGRAESQPVFALIRAAAARGVAVLYISHRLAEITSLADHVTVLRDGRVVLSAAAADLATDDMITAMVGSDLDTLFPDRTATPGDVLLEVAGLRSEPLVQDITFTVRAGEIVGLAGLVGAGAAETVAALFGDRPSSGRIAVHGRKADSANPRQAAGRGFALVPPERRAEAVFGGVSLRDNVTAASLEQHSRVGVMDRRAESATAQRVVEGLGVVAQGLDQDFATLSGGNQQKAIVGRWLERGAEVFLVSEPTAGVDVAARVEIYRQLGTLAEDGAAVVVSSTDFEELVGLCDRILVVRDGRICGEVTADETDVERLTSLTAAPADDPSDSAEGPAAGEAPAAATPPRRGIRGTRLRQVSVPLAMLVVLAILAAGAPSLLTAGSLVGILNQAATPALLAAALAVALGSGSFDLSIGATAHFSANLSAMAVVMGAPPVLALALGVAAGLAVGLVNGAIAGVLRVPSFVATLGMLFVLVGLTLGLNGGLVTSIPRTSGYLLFGQGWILRLVPALVVWTVITIAILAVVWRRTRLGLRLRAVGDDAAVAGLRGVPVRRTALLGLAISGMLSGMAGALMASYSNGATANDVSLSLLVSALAAAFLGLSMTRGLLFDPATAVVGALFVTAVGVGLIANGLPDQLLTGVQGLALLFAVLVAVVRRRRLGQVAIF